MRTIPLAALVLLFAAPLQAQQPQPEPPRTTRVSGTLLGADGRPMRMAHVGLYPLAGEGAIQTVQVAADGSYVLDTDSLGVFSLLFTGVDHLMQSRPLLLERTGGTIEIDARLGSHDFLDDLSQAAVIGEFNGFSFAQGSREMEARDDGTYVLELEWDADTLAYQLINVAGTRSINGTQSERFVYDGGGDYRSVISVRDGKARILFDPGKLHVSDAQPSVRFRDPDGLQARYADFTQLVLDERDAYLERRQALEQQAAGAEALMSFDQEYDWSKIRNALDEWLQETDDLELRGTLLLTYIGHSVAADSVHARVALGEIPPGSPKWGMLPFVLMQAIYSAGQPEVYEDFVYAVLRENRSEEARASALMFLLGRASGEEKESELRILYTWLASEYPESFQAEWATSEYDPARAIQPGNPVPEFELASLEDSTVIYSNVTMLGQVYLMDFWAVWCAPCVAEMPYLHAAYEKYKEDGFTILSLSFDQKPQDVIEYREAGAWKMPWRHAFVEGGFASELAKSFQVVGIPKPILIGADGLILATFADLNGPALDRTLAGVFGREPTASEERKQ
jgi:thiol-disulfide isomerase/thioredoxin